MMVLNDDDDDDDYDVELTLYQLPILKVTFLQRRP